MTASNSTVTGNVARWFRPGDQGPLDAVPAPTNVDAAAAPDPAFAAKVRRLREHYAARFRRPVAQLEADGIGGRWSPRLVDELLALIDADAARAAGRARRLDLGRRVLVAGASVLAALGGGVLAGELFLRLF